MVKRKQDGNQEIWILVLGNMAMGLRAKTTSYLHSNPDSNMCCGSVLNFMMPQFTHLLNGDSNNHTYLTELPSRLS